MLDVEEWRKTKTTNFLFSKRWRRMGNGDVGWYTTALFWCSFLFRFLPAAVWVIHGLESFRINFLCCRDICDSALELILLTLVTADCFAHFVFPIHFLLPVPFLKPVFPENPPLGCGGQPCPTVGWLELSARAAPHRHCPAALQDQSLDTYTWDTKIWHLRTVDGVWVDTGRELEWR